MDSTQAAQVNSINDDTSAVNPPPPVNRDLLPAEAKKEESLMEIKARFLNEAKQVDVLAPLRTHPWASVGSAALLGAVAGVVTAAFAKPKVVVYQDEKQRDEHEAKPQKGAVMSVLALLQPLVLKAGQTAANAWLAKRQAGNTYEPSTNRVEAYE